MPITDEARILIFDKLKKNLEKFVPPMIVKTDLINTTYEIIGNKPVPYGYNKKIIPGMFFANINQLKGSVTFHFFPSYMNPKLNGVAPSLYKCLKGKTCFHFNNELQINEGELTLLLENGINAWRKYGYLE